MKSKKDESTCVYGAGVIVKQTQALRDEFEGVRSGEDIEYLHRMRVASRRLRTAIMLFPNCIPNKKRLSFEDGVRQLTRALGDARDTDVQIDLVKTSLAEIDDLRLRTGVRRLLLRLLQRRDKLQVKVVAMLDQVEQANLLKKIDSALAALTARQGEVFLYTPSMYDLANRWICTQLDDFLAFDPYVDQPEQIEKLHAMRIAAKHLRYSLEAFAALYADGLKDQLQVLRKAQEALGDIHDCDVWNLYLPKFIEKEQKLALDYYGTVRPVTRLLPGIQYFQKCRQEQRSSTYTGFVVDWVKWKQKDVWNQLRAAVTNPYLPPVSSESTDMMEKTSSEVP